MKLEAFVDQPFPQIQIFPPVPMKIFAKWLWGEDSPLQRDMGRKKILSGINHALAQDGVKVVLRAAMNHPLHEWAGVQARIPLYGTKGCHFCLRVLNMKIDMGLQ